MMLDSKGRKEYSEWEGLEWVNVGSLCNVNWRIRKQSDRRARYHEIEKNGWWKQVDVVCRRQKWSTTSRNQIGNQSKK